jgi:hypothetical protein
MLQQLYNQNVKQHSRPPFNERMLLKRIEYNIAFRQTGREADHVRSVTYLFVVVAYPTRINNSLQYRRSKSHPTTLNRPAT